MRAPRTVALLIALSALIAGCGSGRDTKTTAATKPTETAPAPKTASNDGMLHMLDKPTNLVADAELKATLHDTAEALARTEPDAQNTELTGPLKGSTYYAGWGDFEYAMGSFDHRNHPTTEGDATASWYRQGEDGDWVAFDFGMYSDITPVCSFPRELRNMWFPEFASGCGEQRGGRTTFTDVATKFRCVAAAKTTSVMCGHWAKREDPFTTTSGQLLADGIGPQGVRLELQTYADERLAYGIPTEIAAGSETFTCIAWPDSMQCSHGDDAAMKVTADGVSLG